MSEYHSTNLDPKAALKTCRVHVVPIAVSVAASVLACKLGIWLTAVLLVGVAAYVAWRAGCRIRFTKNNKPQGEDECH